MSNVQTATVVAAPAFSADAVRAAAVALSTADKSFASAIATVAEQVARILTAEPTYALWEGVASTFVADYAKARGCETKTAENRWTFVVAELRSRFALEKPAKPTEAAQAKAAQRAAKAGKVEAILKAHDTVESLMRAAEKADPKERTAFAEAIVKATKDAARDASTKAKETEKALREEARTIIGKLQGKQLERALAALRKLAPADLPDATV